MDIVDENYPSWQNGGTWGERADTKDAQLFYQFHHKKHILTPVTLRQSGNVKKTDNAWKTMSKMDLSKTTDPPKDG